MYTSRVNRAMHACMTSSRENSVRPNRETMLKSVWRPSFLLGGGQLDHGIHTRDTRTLEAIMVLFPRKVPLRIHKRKLHVHK